MAEKGGRESRESRIAEGWTVEADPAPGLAVAPVAPDAAPGGDPATDDAITEPAEGGGPRQLSNGGLVVLGAIGGVYLLYTLVWFSWANYYSSVNSAVADGSGAIGAVMQQIVFWIAPFAPALWFWAVLVLNRGASLGRLMLWLLIGAVVLVPLPMFVFGAAA